MFELVIGGTSIPPVSPEYLQLKKLEYTGSAPTTWAGYENNIAFRPNKNEILLGGGDGYQYPFNLTNQSFGSRTSFPRKISYGSRFSEADSLDGYFVRWGLSSGSAVASAVYYNQNNSGSSVSVGSNGTSYFSQCTVGDNFYMFGGNYGRTVEATNDMKVFYSSGANKTIVSHGTVSQNMCPLLYNCHVGHTDKEIFVFGGVYSASSGNTISRDVWKYDLSTKAWSKVQTTTPVTIGTGTNAPFYAGKFWFLGATTVNGAVANKTLYSFQPASGAWKEEAVYDELETYRSGQLFVYKDKLYYVMPLKSQTYSQDIFTVNLK